MLWCLAMYPRGEVYREYNIVPNTQPCGTPCVRCDECDEAPSTTTNCVRSDIYETGQSKASLQIPKRVDNLFSKIIWSTVSNTADKSRRTGTVEYPLSMAVRMQSLYYEIVCMPTAEARRNCYSPDNWLTAWQQPSQSPWTKNLN